MSSGLPPPTANPWLDWPRPISLVQPNLQITLSKFQCHISETAGYPYRLNTHSGTEATIYFHEMRGFGNPPGDVGYPGDVYIDMSSGGPFLWATQMTNNGEWKRWALDERMQHPHFPFRFLWCSKGEVSWYCPAKFEQLSNHEKGQRTAEELVVEMLRATGRGNDGASNAAFAQSKRLMLPASTFNSSSFGTSTSIYEKSLSTAPAAYLASRSNGNIVFLCGDVGTSTSIYEKSLSTAPAAYLASRSNGNIVSVPHSTPSSETILREEPSFGDASKKNLQDVYRHLSAKIAYYQRDVKYCVEEIVKHNERGQSISNICRLLFESNKKLEQSVSEMLVQYDALVAVTSTSLGGRGEKQPADGQSQSARSGEVPIIPRSPPETICPSALPPWCRLFYGLDCTLQPLGMSCILH